jgi:hypothetical protein
MKFKFVLKAIVGLLLIAQVSANYCEVKSGEIEYKGKKYTKDGWIESCEGSIKVVGKQTEVCLFDNSKNWNCKQLTVANKTLPFAYDVAEFSVHSDYEQSFLDTLFEFIRPVKIARDDNYGGKKAKDAVYLTGFPTGEILLPEDYLFLDTVYSTQKPIGKFYLYEENNARQKVFNVENAGKNLKIPASYLKAEKTYAWEMVSMGESYVGKFTIVAAEYQQEVIEAFNGAQSQQKLSGIAKILLWGSVADEYGYPFDHLQALSRARAMFN